LLTGSNLHPARPGEVDPGPFVVALMAIAHER
jgi:hypothetical protein